MHGPTRRAGAVAALEGIKTPSEVARLVLKYTITFCWSGRGEALRALSYGFKEEDLLTPESRELWLRWRANRGKDDDWIDVTDPKEPLAVRPTGTINRTPSTRRARSPRSPPRAAWPGRSRVAGDSPIVGVGQYTDNEIGAAGSTGRGESNIMVCGGFLTVEHMRRGMAPTDAALETLKRVVAMTPPSLMNPQGRPRFQLTFYAVNKKGETGAASLYPAKYAVHDGSKAELRDAAYVHQNT
jgi:N4-(beta-N-acetylglucosaminyl)-L-asparaginase